MDGIVWLFFALLLIAASLVLGGLRRRQLAADHASRPCPHCQTPISMRRRPLIQVVKIRGRWLCPHCGAKSGALAWLSRTAPP